MKSKEILVFVLLGTCLVAAFGGFAFVSRGEPLGWIGVAIAAPLLFIVKRSMRLVSAPTPVETPAEKAPPADWVS